MGPVMSLFFPPESEETAAAEPAPPPAPRPRLRWVRRTLAVVAALVVVALIASAIYLGSVSKSFTSNLQRRDLLPSGLGTAGADPSAPARPVKGNGKAVDYVLMGSDSREADNANAGRSDTLMVLHLAADRKNAYLISFPRDMYVSIPGHGKNKINAAFSFGGSPLAVETLEQLLGTRMDHVALVDFDGFIRLTEQLGGVTVYNAHASKSRGYTFPKGEITVKGDQALAFVRERYELPNGDLDRAERQRLVVQAIVKKALSRDVLVDPAEFTGFVTGVAQNVTVDNGLSDTEIRNTALSLRMGADDLKLLQAPITGFDTVHGQSIDVVDTAGLAEMAKALRNDDLDTYVEQHPSR
jgi:LCP family protein required for cell wall assembly